MASHKGRPSIEFPPIDELAAMVREAGIATVADDFGCAVNTLADRLNRAGYTMTGRLMATSRDDGDLLPAFQWNVPEWSDRALCAQVDPEAFFPEKGGSTREAKAVCARCTVAAECLDWALDHHERFGIWGGHSERERRKLVRHSTDPLARHLDAS